MSPRWDGSTTRKSLECLCWKECKNKGDQGRRPGHLSESLLAHLVEHELFISPDLETLKLFGRPVVIDLLIEENKGGIFVSLSVTFPFHFAKSLCIMNSLLNLIDSEKFVKSTTGFGSSLDFGGMDQ